VFEARATLAAIIGTEFGAVPIFDPLERASVGSIPLALDEAACGEAPDRPVLFLHRLILGGLLSSFRKSFLDGGLRRGTLEGVLLLHVFRDGGAAPDSKSDSEDEQARAAQSGLHECFL
jgi:hypothetical protein